MSSGVSPVGRLDGHLVGHREEGEPKTPPGYPDESEITKLSGHRSAQAQRAIRSH